MHYRQHQDKLIDVDLHYEAIVCDNPPNQPKVYEFECKLSFDIIQPKYPGRAVFSLRPDISKRDYRLLELKVNKRKMFKRLRDEARPSRLSGAAKSVPGSRIRFFESPVGMFVVQVRGSVGDCALPALNIDPNRHEVSFDWRDLFDRYFGEQKVAKAVLHDAAVGHPGVRHFALYLI